jgi:hypothetical protein
MLRETAVHLSQLHQKLPGCLDVAVHGLAIIEGENIAGWSKVNTEESSSYLATANIIDRRSKAQHGGQYCSVM